MTTEAIQESIRAALISSRNILMQDRYIESIASALADAGARLAFVEVHGTRLILEEVIPCVLELTGRQAFSDAALFLNFVHNLPMSIDALNRWDVSYFLSTELAGFLEHEEFVAEHVDTVLAIIADVILIRKQIKKL